MLCEDNEWLENDCQLRLRDFWVVVRRECVPKQAQTTAFCVPEAELLEIPTHRIDIEIATDPSS